MLILALIGFGMLIGWLAQLILGMGTRPNGQSLAAGLIGSVVGGLLGSLIAGDGLAFRASGEKVLDRVRITRASLERQVKILQDKIADLKQSVGGTET